MNILQTLLEEVFEELHEKVIRVAKHMTSRQRKKSKLFRVKNKSKLKKRAKLRSKKLKLKKKPKAGYSWGADMKLHKVVRVKGRRKHH